MIIRFVAALLLAASVGACATIIRGTDQEVSVNTTPIGATVQFSNGQSCVSPCKIKSARNASLLITISKPGCQTQTSTMMPTLAGGGVLLGGLIDYGTGAVYDLQPNPLTLTLACGPEGMSAPPPPVPSNVLECVTPGGQKLQIVGQTQCPENWKPAS